MSTIIACQPNQAAEHLAQNQGAVLVLVFQNGSRFAGEPPASLAELLALLDAEPLRADQAEFGFIIADPLGLDEKPLFPHDFVSFRGNFERLSHGFNVATNDPAVIAQLTAEINRNLKSDAFRALTVKAL